MEIDARARFSAVELNQEGKQNRTGSGDNLRVEALVKTILQELATHPNGPHHDGRQEEVLLDMCVDGERILLMRMPPPKSAARLLSPREQEIVRMIAKGHSNKVIADFLEISAWTVCTHVRRIFAKLGVASRAAMVAQLLKERTSEDVFEWFDRDRASEGAQRACDTSAGNAGDRAKVRACSHSR